MAAGADARAGGRPSCDFRKNCEFRFSGFFLMKINPNLVGLPLGRHPSPTMFAPHDISKIYYFKLPHDDYKFEEVELHVTATQVAESEDEDATHSALETLQ